MFGLDIAALAANVFLLVANPVQCTVPEAPLVNIVPTTQEVQYDFSKSSKELSLMKNNTILPYPPNTDTVSGGLRADRPVTAINITWGYTQYQKYNAICMWYKQVDVTIMLAPVIYIAEEFDRPKCKKAILEHELKHVDTDRIVINGYAQNIGLAVQDAVNSIGAMGPYQIDRKEEVQEKIKNYIESTIASKELLLFEEMSRKQQAIDSLEEYEKISTICRNAK